MKISENWLRQWVNPNLDAKQIGEQLTMAGLELDELSQMACDFSGVVIGEIVAVEKHPDADKLNITKVNVGQNDYLQIVCGASNVAVGKRVPTALVGAILPSMSQTDDKPVQIQKGKLRGVLSEGMLCGGREIDCDDGVDGLLILPSDAPIGEDVRRYLALDESILDISITPNRGDCFSIRGIARELCAINQLPFAMPFAHHVAKIDSDDKQSLSVESSDCPRYFAQVLNAVNNTPSPTFISRALQGAGIKPRNILVDVTNFVLLELGQPLHAFDKDKIVGAISVRTAKQGETLILLNEQEITLMGDELVIADDEGVIALAGIMGGARTAVSDDTKNVVIESAFFAPLAIAGKARRFGLHTDASLRFERGVDFELPRLALDRAVSLLQQFAGGVVGQMSVHDNLALLPMRQEIHVAFDKIQALLGVSIEPKVVVDILNRLEIRTVLDENHQLICTPPSHRYDIHIAEDIIEEVARLYGYDNITNVLPDFAVNFFDYSKQTQRDDLKSALIHAGYFEAISFSFSDDKIEQLLNDDAFAQPLALANPISSELAVMRRTLLSSLLPCIQYNLNRQKTRVRLFEMGLRFDGDGIATLNQIESLGIVAVGTHKPEQAYKFDCTSKSGMDFYDFKDDVESLLPAHLLETGDIGYKRSQRAFLHTGQGADIWAGEQVIGYLGQLHPKIAKAMDLPITWVAQLDVPALLDLYQDRAIVVPSKFPSVRRDIAILVDKDVAVSDILSDIRIHAGPHLRKTWLFDVYEGEHLPAHKKSLAFAMIWQDMNATLDDETIHAVQALILQALQNKYQAVLRD